MHSAEELAEIAGVETEVVEESFEAANRLIPTETMDAESTDLESAYSELTGSEQSETHEDEFRNEEVKIPDVDDIFSDLDNHD